MSGFSNPIIGGGGALVYPQINSPNFSIAGMTGWGILKNGSAYFFNITASGTITATTFVGTDFVINSAGAFFYSGTPALGNLIASNASASGTDSFGNTVIGPGWVSYNPDGTGKAIYLWLNANTLTFGNNEAGVVLHAGGQVNQSDVFVNTAAPALNLVSPTSKGSAPILKALMQLFGESQDGTVTPFIIAGSTIGALSRQSAAFFELQGSIAFGQSAALLASVSTDGSGYPQFTDNAGLLLNISGSKVANIAGTTVTTVTNTSLGFMQVPGSDVEAGSAYVIHASGSFSTGGTAPTSATFRVYWGGIAGTILASIAVPAAGLIINAAGLGWAVDAEVDWISTTNAETTLTLKWHTASGVAGSVQWFAVSNVTGLTTTSSQGLALGFQWGSAPGGQILQCDVERTGRAA